MQSASTRRNQHYAKVKTKVLQSNGHAVSRFALFARRVSQANTNGSNQDIRIGRASKSQAQIAGVSVNGITRAACDAFISGDEFTRQNMHVHHNGDGDISRMYLHGNMIASRDCQTVRITLAGWPTPTTRARLNGLLELLHINKRLYQHKKAQYIGNSLTQTSREITAYEWIQL